MRRFVLLLALVYPAVLLYPSFWAVVSIFFGAHPITYVEADGRVQPAVLGPKARWPDWASVPAGASFAVSAWFAASPPSPEMGFGNLGVVSSGHRPMASAYVDKLRAEGWTVEAAENKTLDPSMPPRPFLECIIVARRSGGDPRGIVARIALEPVSQGGTVYWWAATPPSAWPKVAGPAC